MGRASIQAVIFFDYTSSISNKIIVIIQFQTILNAILKNLFSISCFAQCQSVFEKYL